MESDASLNSKSSTTASPSQLRYVAIYAPTPEHLWVPGIPARNLDADEVERYGVQNLRNAQCYELVSVESLDELVEELAEE